MSGKVVSDIIIVDESDCISGDDSNSKGIQANFAPVDPRSLFPIRLPKTVDNLKRVHEADHDTFTSGGRQNEKKTTPSKKKRKIKPVRENNKTIEHFHIQDKQTYSDNSYQSSSFSVDGQEVSHDELGLTQGESNDGLGLEQKVSYDEFGLEKRTVESPVQSIPSSVDLEESTEEIPVLANVDDVLVTHYMLDLSVHFDLQVMTGSIVLFIEPANEEATKKSFHLCLDSTLVNIQSVNEVVLPDDFNVPFFRNSDDHANVTSPRVNVQETTDEKGSQKTVIEISDDDDDDNQSPDQSDASAVSSSSATKDDTSFSLFQRLQQNFGFVLNEKSSTSTGNLSSNKPNSSNSQRTTSASVDSGVDPTNPSSLPELLNFVNGTSSSQQPLSYKGLKYSVYGWCVKVNKEGATGKDWPRCICIKYQTSPDGQSLTWTKDQDGR